MGEKKSFPIKTAILHVTSMVKHKVYMATQLGTHTEMSSLEEFSAWSHCALWTRSNSLLLALSYSLRCLLVLAWIGWAPRIQSLCTFLVVVSICITVWREVTVTNRSLYFQKSDPPSARTNLTCLTIANKLRREVNIQCSEQKEATSTSLTSGSRVFPKWRFTGKINYYTFDQTFQQENTLVLQF